ncbi:hypothetical protein AB0C96_13780 [Streptomyces sp. NPDC048506]|uniref:hypothetical protein n=1 Tax=Streptomyces sp. NPDC048506 TaxID=3155028 RepID=UPI0034313852
MLTARWLTAVGLVSYSLFIWHEPVMLQLHHAGLLPTGQSGFPLALLIEFLVAVPVAAVSYWLLEYPASMLGRLKDGSGRPREFYPEPAARRPPPPSVSPGTRAVRAGSPAKILSRW